MNDREFLDYLTLHLETPECGVTPDQIAHLLNLAGRPRDAELWMGRANTVIRREHEAVRQLVGEARRNLT